MITLLVNWYAEDPEPAIRSAKKQLPIIDRVVKLEGRYEGFPEIDIIGYPQARVFPSEHAKRNELIWKAGPPDENRWLMFLDCDERVVYASPAIEEQLKRLWRLPMGGDVAGVRFVEPLTRAAAPGLNDPRRSCRDHVIEAFPRLVRHLPGLEFTERHDHLVDGEGRLLIGWASELPMEPDPVDIMIVHLKTQSAERIAAKKAYYRGPTRTTESKRIQDSVAEYEERAVGEDAAWGSDGSDTLM